MISNPYILLDENSWKSYLISIFSLMGLSITILFCTLILPMPQLQAQ